jgi:hypothetical protein
MVAAYPLADEAQKQAWIARQLAELTPEERAKYDSDAFFRGIVDATLEREWRAPSALQRERTVREQYGDDYDRERADIESGIHPLQQTR